MMKSLLFFSLLLSQSASATSWSLTKNIRSKISDDIPLPDKEYHVDMKSKIFDCLITAPERAGLEGQMRSIICFNAKTGQISKSNVACDKNGTPRGLGSLLNDYKGESIIIVLSCRV